MFALKRQKSDAAAPAATAAMAPGGIGLAALRFLAEQQLEPTPHNYALAYALKQDRFCFCAMTVDAVLMDGRRLTQADVDRIMATNALREAGRAPDDRDDRHDVLRHQTLKVAELTAGAVANSTAFGRDLSDGLHYLSGGAASIEAIVGAMIDRTRDVETQLRSASSEIETLRQQVETVRGDALRDALTGLLNRRGAAEELEARRPAQVGTVALCDIDHFKAVNDRYGHAVGDRVLKGVAASLAESCGVHQVARWGGEEFLVILDGVAPARAVEVLERARADLARRTFRIRETDEPLGQVTVSIGVASLASMRTDAAIEAADRYLYEAKRRGRNRLVAQTEA